MPERPSDITFNPGPSEPLPQVAEYTAEAHEKRFLSEAHREEWFSEVFWDAAHHGRRLLGVPPNYLFTFVGSATESMGITARSIERHSYHLTNGHFPERWAAEAAAVGKQPTFNRRPWGKGFVFNQRLHQRIAEAAPELLCVVQTETSTGARINPADIARLKARHPGSLIAVDITSSAPYVDLDFSQIDLAFFSVQKGFGMPAGLGVIIASPEAIERAQFLADRGCDIGGFHALPNLAKAARKDQTVETPNMQSIFVFGKVAADLHEYGLDNLRQETDLKAEALYSFFEQQPGFQPFVAKPADRSPTVIVAEVAGGSTDLIQRARADHNIVIGRGYGPLAECQIRIGNFPAHSEQQVADLIGLLGEKKS